MSILLCCHCSDEERKANFVHRNNKKDFTILVETGFHQIVCHPEFISGSTFFVFTLLDDREG